MKSVKNIFPLKVAAIGVLAVVDLNSISDRKVKTLENPRVLLDSKKAFC